MLPLHKYMSCHLVNICAYIWYHNYAILYNMVKFLYKTVYGALIWDVLVHARHYHSLQMWPSILLAWCKHTKPIFYWHGVRRHTIFYWSGVRRHTIFYCPGVRRHTIFYWPGVRRHQTNVPQQNVIQLELLNNYMSFVPVAFAKYYYTQMNTATFTSIIK